MSDAVCMPDFRSREFQHAICTNCGEVVRVSVSDFRSREIKLWWTTPLAAIIWLAIIWKFGYALNSSKVGVEPSPPIEASFMELPEDVPNIPAKNPEVNSQPIPKHSEILPPPYVLQRTDLAGTKPAVPINSAPAENKAPPTDLMSYVNAASERLHAAEIAAERENSEARAKSLKPTPDEIRMAKIMRNLQPEETNGMFEIVSIGSRTAKFSFRGWTKDASNARREMIEVDAGPDGDVERAMVRSMIGLIRKYYKGDFNWESQRLDRVIVLSARLEDNAGLEEFLMREFFGVGVHGVASQY